MTTRKCKLCHQDKPENKFKRKGKYRSWTCNSCKYKIKLKREPSFYRDSYLRERYGISEEQYLSLLQAQNGLCAICNNKPSDRRLAVDHDHETSKVRGLLCHHCNSGLGNLKDSIDLLKAAINYLKTQARGSP